MIEDYINFVEKELLTYGLMLDFGIVEQYHTETISLQVSLENRIAFLDNVKIVGSYTPKKGDKGIVIFSGKTKFPYFIPINDGTYNKGGEHKTITEKKEIPSKNKLGGIYVISHSWWHTFKDYEGLYKKQLNYIFAQTSGNLDQALSSAKQYKFTDKFDCIILMGLNDGLSDSDGVIKKFNKLIDYIKDKVGTIYVCNVSTDEDYKFLKDVTTFNSKTNQIKNCKILDIYTELKGSKFTSDNFHLVSYEKLATYLSNILKG